jgi:hypothetical protein
VRLRSLSNGLAQLASPKLDLPYRAASCALSRKSTQSAAPEVPSTTSASPLGKAAASARGRILELQPADTFVTNITPRPDGTETSLARLPGMTYESNDPIPGQPQRPWWLLRLEQFVG